MLPERNDFSPVFGLLTSLLRLKLGLPTPPNTFSVDLRPRPKDPNQDSFLGSVFEGTGMVKEGRLSFEWPPSGLAAKALEMSFINLLFLLPRSLLKAGGLCWLPKLLPLLDLFLLC